MFRFIWFLGLWKKNNLFSGHCLAKSSFLEKPLPRIWNYYFKIVEKSPKHPRANQIRKSIAGLLMFSVQASVLLVRFGRMLSKENKFK